MSMKKIDVTPLYTRVLLDVYKENPYETTETAEGFKLTKGEFDNPDTGDRDYKNAGIWCAKVVDAGSECKYISQNDDVLVPVNCLRPIVLRDKTYFTISEENIILKLKEVE